MYDFHSHFIYGVDDGSETIEESVKIIEEAHANGIKVMIATPHFIKGSMDTEPETLKERLYELKKIIDQKGIEIDLLLGNEIYLEFDTNDDLEAERCLTLSGTDYVLIELPFESELLNLDQMIYKLKRHNRIPVLAHPERYRFIQEDIERLDQLIEIGLLCQLNLSSLNGRYGKQVKQTAERLVASNMIHIIGTDVHHENSAALNIAPALKTLKKLSKDNYEDIYQLNGQKILRNELVKAYPRVIKKKKRKWPKRVIISLLLVTIMIASGGYYAFKKVEAQFEQAMIQQAQAIVAAEERAEKAAQAKVEKEKIEREAVRLAEKEAREKLQAEEDAKREEELRLLEEKLIAEEKAALERAEQAKNEAEKAAAEKEAVEARLKKEEEIRKAEALKKQLETERVEKEKLLAAEAAAEEAKLEAERIERERIIEEEKAKREAEMAEMYTDYETDKAKALELAISKLTVEQINRLIELAAGGFEPEEKLEAKEMFYNNFTEEEQTWILDMYVKYYGS